MSTSNNATSITDAARAAGYVPDIRPGSSMEELDEWIAAIGGTEMTSEEAANFDRQVDWAPVSGEDHRGNAVPNAEN